MYDHARGRNSLSDIHRAMKSPCDSAKKEQYRVLLWYDTETVTGEVANFRTLNKEIAVIYSLRMAWAIPVSIAYSQL